MLKDKKFIRRLAWLLCLSLIVGLVPVGLWSMPVNAVPEGTVVFTDGAEAYNFKSKWSLTGSVMAWSDAGYKYAGDRVLLMQTPNDTATSPAFAVTPGKAYTLSYVTKQHTAPAGDAGKGSVQIRFYDAGGALIAGATVKATACNVTDWTEKTLTAVAPADAATAKLYFDTENDAKLIYVVDEMTVVEHDADPDATVATEATEATEATQPAGNPVVNAGFEDELSSWNNYINATVVTDDVHSGSNAVRIEDIRTDAGGYISQTVPAVAGTTVELSAWIKVLDAGTQGYMGIYGIGNAAVATSTGTSNVWTKISVSVVVPDGYESVTIEIGSGKGARTIFLVDDVTVTVVGAEPEVTEPSTEATEPSTEATEATAPVGEPIYKETFESFDTPKKNVNIPKGWTLSEQTAAIGSAKYDKQYDGTYNLFLQDPADKWAKSPLQQAVAGDVYTVTFVERKYTTTAGNGGYAKLVFVDDNGTVLKEYAMTVGTSATWTMLTLAGQAPEGATKFYIEFGLKNPTGEPTYGVDDLKVYTSGSTVDPEVTEPSTEATEPTEDTTPTAPTEATEPPVFKDSFENFYTPDGASSQVRIPNGWTSSCPNSGALSSAMYDKGYDGSWNLCIQDPSDKTLTSSLTEAIPGYEYHVVFHEKKYQPGQAGDGGFVRIVFVDANGKVLKEYEAEAGTSKTWTEKTLFSKAPAGATHFYVEFGLSAPTGEPTYSVDDLAVYAYEAALGDPDVTQPTEPVITIDPMKPLEDKFENLFDSKDANSGPVGWFSNDDAGSFAPMISLVKDDLSYDGYYLRLQKAGKWTIQSQEFPVQIGYEYTIAFKARKLVDNENYFGYVEISFVNTRGKVIETKRMTIGKTYGQWADESMSVAAPLDAYKAYIVFGLEYNDRRAEGDYAIDDLVVTRSENQVFEYIEDPNSNEPTEFKTVFTDGFSSYYKPDPSKSVNLPQGWTASEQSAAIGTATYDDYDGSRNLCLQDRGDKWIKSPLIKATAGNFYYASFVEKKLQPNQEGTGGYMKVCFVDANGKVIMSYDQVVGASKTWIDTEVGGQAPEGATHLYIEFGIANATGAPSYSIDVLKVIEGKPSKPGSTQPSTPVNPGNPDTPDVGDDNTNTADNAMLMSASVVLVAAMAMVVLVIKKRKFF